MYYGIGYRKDSLLSTMIYVSTTDAKIRKKLIYDRFVYANGKIKPRKEK